MGRPPALLPPPLASASSTTLVVTMAMQTCIVSEICRDVGRILKFFDTSFGLNSLVQGGNVRISKTLRVRPEVTTEHLQVS